MNNLLPRRVRRMLGKQRITNFKAAPIAVRITNPHRNGVAHYEIRLANNAERVFHKWNHLIKFMYFPVERGPELFAICFTNRGEWVEFSEVAEEHDDEALNTPILYECAKCATMSTITPIQSVMTKCKCGGEWVLVDIDQYKTSLSLQRGLKR
jgi:hypothetical protein